ncbi:succinate dehydrogenase, hydrophobic membrane anchor protein [Arhodomonas sp. SL1]|uniref:succinate dehydrogenase, hydrophobic membrane anchor protein n=1 Tax=Arhodomonas sp. SL1 TaxID=3425691 RepID=UPI003F8836AC
MNFRTPIKQARGLGSAHHGATHWWLQRLTAVALVPLMLWFAVGVATLSGGGYTAAAAWLSSPFNAALMVLVVGLVFWHGALGIQVVLEDYVGDEALRQVLIVAVKFLSVLFALVGIISVLTVALGG